MAELVTTNGAITIKTTKAQVRARTTNGSIKFDGALADGDQTFILPMAASR
jgi:hypothetical protein